MRIRRSRWTEAAVVAAGLAVIHTWPLATAPARLSLNYHGDVMLNEWIVAWVQHQLPRAPLALFQANIFHPTPDVLALSEPLIVPALLGYAARIPGASPVLVHNLLLLAGLALTMVAGYALVHHWTKDHLASIVAGAAIAFNTQSFARLEHLQAAHAYGVPLALLAADKLIMTAERKHVVWLAVWMAVMAYTSGYLVVITTIALGVMLLVRGRHWWGRPRVIAGFVAAAALTSIVVLPVFLPYRRAAVEQGLSRPIDGVIQFSATLGGYVTSRSYAHRWLWNSEEERDASNAFFPGIAIALLASIAVVSVVPPARGGTHDPGRARLRTVTLSLVALAIVGLVLSLGTRTPVYGWLYAIFPPLSSLRAAARFGALFLLAVAALAGIGLAVLRNRMSQRAGAAAAFAALACVTVEAFRAPWPYVEFRGIPQVYSMLADEKDVVLVEVPFYPPEAIFMNAEYVLNSTAHWMPLMNGYSGYTPGDYRKVWGEFWRFPEPAAVDAMKAAGATHIMLHPARFEAEAAMVLERALANPQLERVAVGGENLTLFRIR